MRGGLIQHEKEARLSLVVELDHDSHPGFLTGLSFAGNTSMTIPGNDFGG